MGLLTDHSPNGNKPKCIIPAIPLPKTPYFEYIESWYQSSGLEILQKYGYGRITKQDKFDLYFVVIF